MYSQQEICKLYNSLFPKIQENTNYIKIQVRGQAITIYKSKKQATLTIARQTIYGR